MNSLKDRGSQIGRKTDVGRVRAANEDSMGDLPIENGHVLIVADGMGGYRGGAIASSLVVEAIEEYFLDTNLEDPTKALRESIYTANERIYLRGKQDEDLSRMGSTCVLALVQANQLHLAHVGDSRIYLLRSGGELQRLTRDHTVVQHFVDVGLLSEEEAEGHPDSHILSRALGPRAHVEPEIQENPVSLRDGDRVLLCSDGLTKMLTENKIRSLLAKESSLQSIVDEMVDQTNDCGGEDNVTVLVYEYRSSGDEPVASTSERKPDIDADFSDETPPLALGLEELEVQAKKNEESSDEEPSEAPEEENQDDKTSESSEDSSDEAPSEAPEEENQDDKTSESSEDSSDEAPSQTATANQDSDQPSDAPTKASSGEDTPS